MSKALPDYGVDAKDFAKDTLKHILLGLGCGLALGTFLIIVIEALQ